MRKFIGLLVLALVLALLAVGVGAPLTNTPLMWFVTTWEGWGALLFGTLLAFFTAAFVSQ